MSVKWIQPDWAVPRGVRALCSLRVGGVSSPPFDSLNLGSHVGDEANAVGSNRDILRGAALLPSPPRWLQQVHGVAVADLDEAEAGVPIADAAVASRGGVVCAVLTADCLPVVLSANDGSAVGVAHAGWRGLAAGVIEATVQALRGRITAGARIQSWLGPAIGAASFEVGQEVREAFLVQDRAAEAAFVANASGRWQCDLYQLARQRLQASGVDEIAGGGLCTYEDADRFYSHRRDVQHRGLSSTGRMATLVWREQQDQ